MNKQLSCKDKILLRICIISIILSFLTPMCGIFLPADIFVVITSIPASIVVSFFYYYSFRFIIYVYRSIISLCHKHKNKIENKRIDNKNHIKKATTVISQLQKKKKKEYNDRIETEVTYNVETNVEINSAIQEEWKLEEMRTLQEKNYFLEKLIKYIVVPFYKKGLIEDAIKTFICYTDLTYNEIITKIFDIEKSPIYSKEQLQHILLNSLIKKPSFIIDIGNALNNIIEDLTSALTITLNTLLWQKLLYESYLPIINGNFITERGNLKIKKLQEAINEKEKILQQIKNSEIFTEFEDNIKKLFTSKKVHLCDKTFMRETNLEFYQAEKEMATIAKENYLTNLNDMNKLQKELIQVQEFLKRASELQKKEIVIQRRNGSIEEFYYNVLMLSVYPILWLKEIKIDYNPENKALVIDYKLPAVENFHIINENGKMLNSKEHSKLYNDIVCQICLRTINEIFVLDNNDNINTVTFNGIVTNINKATGKNKTACIMSLQVENNKFNEINLENVDAIECFRYLHGVGASELSSITPINPIRKINNSDKRFVDAYEVLDNISSETNLAAMDWKDFENLIREVFEKEFSNNGGEVKITQASRDGGVDAITYDPDPIKGGKIIIQAKRYTNIVGVTAVRDLYGTVMNEGANSGILVTTSDYGADSYEFANGKPIKLMNGAELLGLLQKHNYKAYINIEKAKDIMKNQKFF